MNYKEAFDRFLSEKTNREYALPIVKKLLRQRLRKEYYIVKGKIKVHRNDLEEKMPQLFEALVEKCVREDKQYDASLIPTIISPEQAPNFYICKESPTEDEIYRFLYLLVSGLYSGDYIVNLDSVDEKLMNKFREDLIREELFISPSLGGPGIDIKKVLNSVGIGIVPQLREFVYSFIIVSFFVSWISSLERREEWIKMIGELGLVSTLEKIGIRDDTALVIFHLPREKKKMYCIPKLRNFILTWYKEYLEGKEDRPSVVKFIFSTYVRVKQYREISSSLLNKFLYYFLSGYVNGELLNKLVLTKISCELERDTKRVGFVNAKHFFGTLSRNI